jgi:hypothetical protein
VADATRRAMLAASRTSPPHQVAAPGHLPRQGAYFPPNTWATPCLHLGGNATSTCKFSMQPFLSRCSRRRLGTICQLLMQTVATLSSVSLPSWAHLFPPDKFRRRTTLNLHDITKKMQWRGADSRSWPILVTRREC